MADEIKVAPTPIQRNELDVATELTQIYFKSRTPESVEDIQITFAKMFAAVFAAKHGGSALKPHMKAQLPEELKK
jgi:hypothetical protein